MFNYWAQIFIMPHEVLDQITKVCRNFLWGGEADYKKPPYVAWDKVCSPKKHGGLGLKNFHIWNKACNAKLLWALEGKKDALWIRWIHGRYLKQVDIWHYQPKADSCWYWKKLCKVRDLFTDYPKDEYKVLQGYHWLLQEQEKLEWTKITWNRANIPRHAFTAAFISTEITCLPEIGQTDQLSGEGLQFLSFTPGVPRASIFSMYICTGGLGRYI